jgi:hypothetical protein
LGIKLFRFEVLGHPNFVSYGGMYHTLHFSGGRWFFLSRFSPHLVDQCYTMHSYDFDPLPTTGRYGIYGAVQVRLNWIHGGSES